MNGYDFPPIPMNVTPETWDKWVAKHGHRLAALGIPELIISTEALWRDFIANGRMEYSGVSNFCVDDLSTDSLDTLLHILIFSYKPEILGELGLYICIRRKLKLPLADYEK